MDESQVQEVTEAKFDEETKNELKMHLNVRSRYSYEICTKSYRVWPLVSYQTITKHEFKIPIKTLTDFEFEDFIVDTKATVI